jgi:hypothetical protein
VALIYSVLSKPDNSPLPTIDPDELATRIAKELIKTTVSGKHYAVARDVVMESQTRDNLVFFSAYGDKLYTPIAILLYARITNLQGIESQVTGVAVELSAKGFHHKVRAMPIPPDITFYGQGVDHVVKELRPDSLLLDALRKPIPPHKFAEGWLFLDVSKQYESLPRPHEYAMTVTDASGNKDIISFGTDENVEFATPSFMAVSVLGTMPPDWTLQHWIEYDPWAKSRPPSER